MVIELFDMFMDLKEVEGRLDKIVLGGERMEID